MTELRVRRVYDAVGDDDGRRILVDRLWPRGVRRESARIDDWAKDAAPSNELRTALHGGAIDHDAFAASYLAELDASGAAATLAHDMPDVVTLVTSVRDVEGSHVPVLREALERALADRPQA